MKTKSVSIADLRLDQKIEEESFSLKEFEKKLSRQGKYYYNLRLGDKTGEIRGKMWQESIPGSDTDVHIGDIVAVNGLVQEYAGKPQLMVTRMVKAEGMAPEEFLPVTSRARDNMRNDIEIEMAATKDPYIKQVLDAFWKDQSFFDKFMNYPAGEYVHHGYVGGYIEHVWEMMKLSKPFYDLYPMLNRDLLFAGIFFHDVGKLEELGIVGASIVRTTEGRLIAHIGQGLLMLDKLIRQIPDFPEDLKTKLYHMLLSHQGELEYGSPIRPQMLESLVLSFIDMNSASMNQAVKHIEKELNTGEDFTEYHKWLRRSFYQKDFLEESET